MDIEFHYYITAFLAYEAGFSKQEAEIIGYSAQYIDDNDVIYKIKDQTNNNYYVNYISQTLNILKPKRELMRIYPVFHFIPGDLDMALNLRNDNKAHLLNTTPNSKYANIIMDNAFSTIEYLRLYRIGIASHSYIDTWAHQNFVGCYSKFNHMKGDFKPNIGHADAESHPDWVAHKWQDTRLNNSEISNLERFNLAAKHLFKKYCQYQINYHKKDYLYKWNNIFYQLKEWQGKEYKGWKVKGRKERIKLYQEYMPWLSEYDKEKWFKQAVKRKARAFKYRHNLFAKIFSIIKDKYFWQENVNIEESSWFKFQEAVKQHQFETIALLQERFEESGLIKQKDF